MRKFLEKIFLKFVERKKYRKFAFDSAIPDGWEGSYLIETGRLRTLSSTHESRKFTIDKKIRQLERLRWVYYTFFYYAIIRDEKYLSDINISEIANRYSV